MIVRLGSRTYSIKRRRGLTYKTFCAVQTLAKMETDLANVQESIVATALAGEAVDPKLNATLTRLQRRIVATKLVVAGDAKPKSV
jgi:hypothetical protein